MRVLFFALSIFLISPSPAIAGCGGLQGETLEQCKKDSNAMWRAHQESTSKAPLVSFFPASNLGQLIYQYLDLKSFRSSFGPKRESVHTLRHYVENDCPDARVLSDASFIEVDCRDWYYKISILSRGDFDGDGIEDLTLRIDDKAKQGTYNQRSFIYVTRTQNEGSILFIGSVSPHGSETPP